MDALPDPSHPDHAEYSAWVAETTGSERPFDAAFLDILAVNPVLMPGKVSVLNVVVSRDVGTDRLDQRNLADSFSSNLSVPYVVYRFAAWVGKALGEPLDVVAG